VKIKHVRMGGWLVFLHQHLGHPYPLAYYDVAREDVVLFSHLPTHTIEDFAVWLSRCRLPEREKISRSLYQHYL